MIQYPSMRRSAACYVACLTGSGARSCFAMREEACGGERRVWRVPEAPAQWRRTQEKKRETMRDEAEDAYTVESLATALSFADGSTVYRWLRGEKAPSVQSPYVDLIIEYLKLMPAQAKDLRDAQVYSLRHRTSRKPRKPRNRPSRTAQFGLAARRRSERGAYQRARPPCKPDTQGERITREMIQLLKKAPLPGNRSEENRTITLTWQSRDTLAIGDELQEEWEQSTAAGDAAGLAHSVSLSARPQPRSHGEASSHDARASEHGELFPSVFHDIWRSGSDL